MPARPPLAFPPFDIPTRKEGDRLLVLDPVRRKWVRCTPEEWVRQHLLRALAAAEYPPGLTAVEKAFDALGRSWRADVAVFSRTGRPLLLAECKAPSVAVDQATFDQLARYNTVLGASCILATNGLTHYCCVADAGSYRFPRLDSVL